MWPFKTTENVSVQTVLRSDEYEDVLKKFTKLSTELGSLELRIEKTESRLLSLQGKMYASISKEVPESSGESKESKSSNSEAPKYL